MTKLKAVLAAAAALVVGGLSIGVALNQAGVAEGMSTQEWCKAIATVNDVQTSERFFITIAQGATIPKAWPEGESGRLLGDCAGGTCTIAPNAAPQCAYTYTYSIGPLVGGWRVAEVFAHPYIAGAWRRVALDNPEFRWYGSMSAVVGACLVHFTGNECLQLLQADSQCWLLDDGGVCRYGNLLGTEDACPYARVAARMPCTVYRGAGSERIDAERVWADEEMDAL